MKLIITLIFSILLMNACQKEATLEEITWTIGADHSTDTTIVVNDLPTDQQSISCDNYSICPNTNVRLTVTQADQTILDSIFFEGFQDISIMGLKNKDILIKTALVQGDSLVDCVWQGQAVFSFH